MKQNVGPLDRIIRVIVGLAALGAGYYFSTWLGLVGMVPLLTATLGFCPLYPLVGINTCGNKRD